ncbi:MAG: hypothetical protein OEW08_06440 [Gammaproteobacteria bacterium]|nr:hypothetical protein [Gammaproteobacteria bacterium]
MPNRSPLISVLTCIAFLLTGCATIVNSRYVEVPVATAPAGAKVTLGDRQYITPTVIAVERSKRNQVAQVNLEGFQPQDLHFKREFNGWIWGNFIFASAFWIGMAVDTINGRAFDIVPQTAALTLVPVDGARTSTTPLPMPKAAADAKTYDIVMHVNFTNESWFPLSKQEMTAAVKDKLLERLSESGRFHFAEATEKNAALTGYINVDITLIESIQTIKLTTTLQIPNGATFIASEDDTLDKKDRRGIYDTFSNVGKKVADNLLKKTNGRI